MPYNPEANVIELSKRPLVGDVLETFYKLTGISPEIASKMGLEEQEKAIEQAIGRPLGAPEYPIFYRGEM